MFEVRCQEFSEQGEGIGRLAGRFPSLEEARAAACRLIEQSLEDLCAPGIGGERLMQQYFLFGTDVYVVGDGDFSGLDYARRWCRRRRA